MPVAFYMDVHIPAAITEQLRLRGVDVVTAKLTNNFKPRYRVAGTVTIHRSGAYFIDERPMLDTVQRPARIGRSPSR